MQKSSLIPLSFSEQINLLKQRGMLFKDETRAEKYLSYIGYHRLSSYWNVFYKDKKVKDVFSTNVYFEDVLDLYIFDRKLRVLFFEASERIEICMKVLLSDIMSMKYSDTFWYTKEEIYKDREDKYYIDCVEQKEIIGRKWIFDELGKNLSKFKKNNESLSGFTNLDNTPIPSWMLVDLITFGNFSNFLNLIEGEFSKEFYAKFNLPKRVLDNWVECMVNVRNICAHYGLLYRRSFSTTPISLSKSKQRPALIDFENNKMSFYAQFFVFAYFIEKISPTTTWSKRVLILIREHQVRNPLLDLAKLGFHDDWASNVIFDKFNKMF